MERNVEKDLLEWKKSDSRMPLIIRGIRQCGKTFTMKKFGEKNYEDVAYFNFEEDNDLKKIFEPNLYTERIVESLGLSRGKKIIPGQTLLILDEIQSCPRALTSLKYFCENMPELHVMCAGSLLGVMLNRESTSFPVGKVEYCDMYPLNFEEFLKATNLNFYNVFKYVQDDNKVIDENYARLFEENLKKFYIIGGMPRVVNQWIKTHDIEEVEKIQNMILQDYRNDFSKHAPVNEIPKINMIWDSIPHQLADLYSFRKLGSGKRAKDYENALMWLIDAGLVYKVSAIHDAQIPLSGQVIHDSFKIYLADVGLLRIMAGMKSKDIMLNTEKYSLYKGPFTENYVLNEFKSNNINAYCWLKDKYELDFIINKNSDFIPVEVKAEQHTVTKSYNEFCKRYKPENGLVLSLKNYGEYETHETQTYTIPLYMMWNLDNYLPKEVEYDFDQLDQRIEAFVAEQEKRMGNKSEKTRQRDKDKGRE